MYSSVVTVMIYGAVVHHPSEAGACLGRCLVDALSEGLEPEQITDEDCNPELIDFALLQSPVPASPFSSTG